MRKIIITASVHPSLIAQLEKHGYAVQYLPTISHDDLVEIVADAHGLVVTTRIKIDKRIIDAAPSLKWIGRFGSEWNMKAYNIGLFKNFL